MQEKKDVETEEVTPQNTIRIFTYSEDEMQEKKDVETEDVTPQNTIRIFTYSEDEMQEKEDVETQFCDVQITHTIGSLVIKTILDRAVKSMDSGNK